MSALSRIAFFRREKAVQSHFWMQQFGGTEYEWMRQLARDRLLKMSQ